MSKILTYFWKDKVMIIAAIAAIFTMFFIPPSISYLGYFKIKVLVCMFGLMIAVGGMYEENFFTVVAIKLVKHFQTVKSIAMVIVLTTFTLGMLITNDAVLLTLIPFSIFVMKEIKQEKQIILLVILQTLAANLGSALTPMGDPQNIYLYTKFNIPFVSFMQSMIPITLTGLILIIATTLLLFPKIRVEPVHHVAYVNDKKLVVYFIIFMVTILCILGFLNDYVALFFILISTLLFNKKLFIRVDYNLLLTFSMFFIFTGNISQIEMVKNIGAQLLNSSTSVYFMGLGVSQLISNVPAAVLISTFTPTIYIHDLLQGVNVGAMGTIIASLASLISYKFVLKDYPKQYVRYLLIYSVICIIYIGIITTVVFLAK
jgi:Na+/H+ antiporter NhaD/arsenite permease-like protein